MKIIEKPECPKYYRLDDDSCRCIVRKNFAEHVFESKKEGKNLGMGIEPTLIFVVHFCVWHSTSEPTMRSLRNVHFSIILSLLQKSKITGQFFYKSKRVDSCIKMQ